MNQSALDTIKRFVAGSITPREFRDRLYADDAFETLLTNDPDLTPSNYVFSSGSAYHFVIALNYDDPGGIVSAQGALCDFMDRNGIQYSKSEQYSDLYDLILVSQPNWLAVHSRYVADHMIPESDDRSGAELRVWLATEFRKRFRSVGQPPDWIQSPDWPINDNGPLIFLGQIDVEDYFHDTASVYVFHDPKSGCCQTIIQGY